MLRCCRNQQSCWPVVTQVVERWVAGATSESRFKAAERRSIGFRSAGFGGLGGAADLVQADEPQPVTLGHQALPEGPSLLDVRRAQSGIGVYVGHGGMRAPGVVNAVLRCASAE